MSKRKMLLATVCWLLVGEFANAQTFNFSLTGNPVNTTGWTTSAQSYVNGDEYVLTNPIGNQAGYIYYATPENLANCSQFTVTFDFQITNGSSPIADGISFWYITNPPTTFTAGGGLGLPTYPNGLVLLLDTYNNDGPSNNNNPLVSLRKYDGTVLQYVEGSSTGQIVPDVGYQSFITDGNWHTCQLTYSFGTITVSFDNNPPIMTGTTTLNMTGYFGFSASTGALWSEQAIKNVTISGAPEPNPPVADTTFYCRYDTAAPLNVTPAPGAQLNWYTSAIGGQPLPEAPVPNTNIPGTYVWYVSNVIQNCNLESTRVPVVAVVKPLPEYDRYDTICPGGSVIFYGRILNTPGTYETTRPGPAGQCDSFIVQHLYWQTNANVATLPNDELSFCQGDSSTIKVANPSVGANYKWYLNGAAIAGGEGLGITVNQAGEYQVVGNLNGCIDTSGKITAIVNPLPVVKIINVSPMDACAFDTVTVQAQSDANEIYQWTPAKVFRYASDGQESAIMRGVFTKPVTKVVVTAYNNFNCSSEDSVLVWTHACCEVFIPNAFTPNGDGLNDYFQPKLQNGQQLLTFTVYDKLGQVIFNQSSGSNKKGWDGNFPNGRPAASGTYMYFIRYTCADGRIYEQHSDVTLLR